MTLPKAKVTDLQEAKDRVQRLEREVAELRRGVKDLTSERDRLSREAERVRSLEVEVQKWGRLMLILRDQLAQAGVPRETVRRVWDMVERELVLKNNLEG